MNYQENFGFRPQGSHDSARGTRRRSCSDLLAPPALPGQGARPALSINTKAATASKPRFACPYHKRSPGLEPKQRSCVYPGFSSIARLKEHLYRHHEQLRCARCSEGFAKAKDLHEHHAARNSCEFQKHQFDYGNGFDQEQKEWLKKKKRTSSTMTDEDKWRDIYLMLFPGEQAVPGPHSHATELDGFHRYWQDNSDRVFQEKASEISNGSTGVPVHLMKKLVDDMHEQICEEFQALQHDDDWSSCTSRASTPMSSPSPRTPLSFEDPPPTADNAELHMPKKRRMGNTEEPRERLFGEVMEGEAYYPNHISMQYGRQGAQPPQIIFSPAYDDFAETNGIIPVGIPDDAQRVRSHVANNAMIAPDHALPTHPYPGMLASQMLDWYDPFTFGGNYLGG